MRQVRLGKVGELNDGILLNSSWLASLMQRNNLVGSLVCLWLESLRIYGKLGLRIFHKVAFRVLKLRKVYRNHALCYWLGIHFLNRVGFWGISKKSDFQILVALRWGDAASWTSPMVLVPVSASMMAPVSVVSPCQAITRICLTRIREFVSFFPQFFNSLLLQLEDLRFRNILPFWDLFAFWTRNSPDLLIMAVRYLSDLLNVDAI